MVAQARQQDPPANLEFREGTAEEGSKFLEDGSVDCVVAGQAAHWFDQGKVWAELRRVLRKEGTVAFWGYKDHVFVDSPRATEIMQHYAYDSHPDMLGSYWPQPGRSYLQDQLRVVQPPEADFEGVERIEYEPGTEGRRSGEGRLFMEKSMKIGECKSYVRTWSSYHGWKEAHPGRESRAEGGKGDIMDEMFEKIAQDTGRFQDDEGVVDVEWGSALIMAKRR